MRLTQLRSFYAVARYGGFTAGGRALHVSQPTVTTQVRALEESYGVELFHRRGRTLRLTEVGETLYAIAQRVFGQEAEAVNFLRETAGLRTGQLRIAAVGPFHVMEMLAPFARRYPGIRVSLRLGNSEATVRSVLAYESDVAVLAQYADDPRLHFVPYREHPVVLFVRRDHRFGRRRSVRLRELAGEPLILREQGSTTRKALEEALATAGVAPRVTMEIGSREAVREAVIRGLGVGAVSAFEYVPDASLRVVEIGDARVVTHAHVACLQERRQARIVRAFMEVVDGLLATPRTTPGRARVSRAPRNERCQPPRPRDVNGDDTTSVSIQPSRG